MLSIFIQSIYLSTTLLTMSYAELTAVPKLVVNEKDVRTDENVMYIASLDEERVRQA